MPEAILLKDVEELGEQGTVVDVSKGYLRNYLIPRKLAQPATKGAIETVRQRQLACALDRPRDLHLVAPAGARDAARADLALLGDELAQRGDVLVVDLLDFVAAVLTGLAPPAAGPPAPLAPAGRLASSA